MKSALIDGKIPVPSSIVSGQLRHQQVAYEVQKLAGVVEAGVPNQDDAEANHRHLREELRQLSAWLAAVGAEPLPPREKREIFREECEAFWKEA